MRNRVRMLLLCGFVAAALTAPAFLSGAHAADCGRTLDAVAGHLPPGPAQQVYWRVCGP